MGSNFRKFSLFGPALNSALDVNANTTILINALFQYLPQFPYLEKLSLSNNGIGYQDSTSTIAVAKGLLNIPRLKVLDLSFNYIDYTDSQGTIILGQELPHLENIQELDLSNNVNLGETDSYGTVALAEGLGNLRTLQSIDFSWCNFGLTDSNGTL
ncbi:MAG TPA: hypothetical protein PLY23_08830 [Alphaproteobacteria bacterium]|nr:hypothetical protein [Alphaproteobacteria bacterium]HQS94702.1 hypothetical protein [Alphaproteobacteria bacterium]